MCFNSTLTQTLLKCEVFSFEKAIFAFHTDPRTNIIHHPTASNWPTLPFETLFDHIQFPNIWLIQSNDFESINFLSSKQSIFSKISKPLLSTALFYLERVISSVYYQTNYWFQNLEQTISSYEVFQIFASKDSTLIKKPKTSL